MSREIGLVSCVKAKQDRPAIPRELYTSSYFKKMRRYSDFHHDEWWILSAKYGLCDPEGYPIEPYDKTLRGATARQKRMWAEKVVNQMQEHDLIDTDARFVIHAGKDYYAELLPLLEQRGATTSVPTAGLGIGEKMAWYDQNT